jgi:lipid A 3-O-deacylase
LAFFWAIHFSLRQDAVAQQEPAANLSSKWQLGGVFMGGYPPYYEIHNPILHYFKSSYYYDGGFEGGRTITAEHGPGFLRGRAEAVVEVLPYWMEHSPAQFVTVHLADGGAFFGGLSEYDIHGVTITPALMRWNFVGRKLSRWMPWAQAGGGVLWTSVAFPQGEGNVVLHGNTSVFNFTPQVAFGDSIFLWKDQSLNFGVHAIHISNAGLGDVDPGINVLVQASIGYSWWK